MLARLRLEVLDAVVDWETDEPVSELEAAIAAGEFGPAVLLADDSPEWSVPAGSNWMLNARSTAGAGAVVFKVCGLVQRPHPHRKRLPLRS